MLGYLQLLEKEFVPPAPGNGKASCDFTVFNLTQPPPADLIELFDLYGPGKFCCGQGDGIELVPTFDESPDFLVFAASQWLQVLDSGNLMDGGFTIPKSFFEVSNNRPPKNLISWGHSDNGVQFMSLWLSHELGWCVLLMPDAFNSARCFFKSPAAVIWEAFFGSCHQDVFPESQGPYHFECSFRV